MKPLLTGSTRINRGTDDRLGKSIDVALVTLVFLGAGWALDRWLDTKPIFMIAFVVLALIGEFVRFWYDYDARMKVLEESSGSVATFRQNAVHFPS